MRIYEVIRSFSVTLALFGLAACAGSGGGATSSPEPSGDEVSIEVRNDMNPPTAVVVWVVPETGSRRRLGSVPPNGRKSFNYPPPPQSPLVSLIAVPEGPSTGTMGQVGERKSNPFSIVDVKNVLWFVSQMNVRIGG
jgi:hypothetical protein